MVKMQLHVIKTQWALSLSNLDHVCHSAEFFQIKDLHWYVSSSQKLLCLLHFTLLTQFTLMMMTGCIFE